MSNYNKIAITGGAGFIGSAICRALLPKGARVLAYDNFFTGRESNLPSEGQGLTIVRADINDGQALYEALAGFKPDVVCHLAALHYIPYCDEHPQETLRVNVEGTESLLQVCAKVRPKKIIAASSAAVYKINDQANKETDLPEPYDIYGYSKYFLERLAAKFHQESGISTLIARIFNTYGPYETTPHVIPRIIDQVKEDTGVIVLGDTSPKRDFVYVEDMAEALIALMEKCERKFDTFNIGTGVEHSVQKAVDAVARAAKRNISVKSSHELMRKTDRMHLLADVCKIRQAVGWEARFSIDEGLQKTVDFYL